MVSVFAALLLGFLAGRLLPLPEGGTRALARLADLLLWAMLFLLGAGAAADPQVRATAPLLGLQALLFAGATGLAGALGAVLWAGRRLLPPRAGGGGDPPSRIHGPLAPLAAAGSGAAAGLLGWVPAPWIDGAWPLLLGLIGLVGVEFGRDRGLRALLGSLGPRSLGLPLAAGVASALAGGLLALPLGIGVREGLALGAAGGWYSLAGVVAAELAGPRAGALAFLANLLREQLTFLLAPVLARRWGGEGAVGLAGATAMDTTLPYLGRLLGPRGGMLALLSGGIWTLLAPILLPWLLG